MSDSRATTPNPGSDAALAIGCACPVLDNARGRGNRRGEFWVSGDCPVHGFNSTSDLVAKETSHATGGPRMNETSKPTTKPTTSSPAGMTSESAPEPAGVRVTKIVLKALEKVFAAEIHGRLPFQSKARIYRSMLATGLVENARETFGRGPFSVTISGYTLTHRGRIIYCQSCGEISNAKP